MTNNHPQTIGATATAAQDWNNRAVAHLQDGSVGLAVELLTRALIVLQQELHCNASSDLRQRPQNEEEEEDHHDAFQSTSPVLADTTTTLPPPSLNAAAPASLHGGSIHSACSASSHCEPPPLCRFISNTSIDDNDNDDDNEEEDEGTAGDDDDSQMDMMEDCSSSNHDTEIDENLEEHIFAGSNHDGNNASPLPFLSSSSSRPSVLSSVTIPLCVAENHDDDDSAPKQEESILPMFNRALLYRTQQEEYEELVDKDLLVAVVLYNLALIRHVRGLQSGRSVYLHKALHIYQLASQIKYRPRACKQQPTTTSSSSRGRRLQIENEQEQDEERASSHYALLALMISYNTAAVHASLFSVQPMRTSLARFRSVLATHSAWTESEDLVFLFLHGMFCQPAGRELALAPAA